MLKQQAKLLRNSLKASDITLIFVAYFLSFELRQRWGLIGDFSEYLWILLCIVPVWHFLLIRFGLYESMRTSSFDEILVALLKVQFFGSIMTLAMVFLIDPKGLSRGMFGIFILASFVFLAMTRLGIRLSLSFFRGKGYNYRNILIVGSCDKTREFIEVIRKHQNWGLKIIGMLHLGETPRIDECYGHSVLGRIEDLVEICKQHPIDEVVFCLPKKYLAVVDDSIKDLEDMGITMRMVLDLYDVRRARRETSLFHGEIPMLTFYYKTFDAGQLLLKRCLDIVGALAGLALTAIMFPFIALALKMDSPGPLLFGQIRMGENGRIFKCWKFRSMYIDAEERKKELAHLNEMNGAIFKIKDDPRITRVGRFIRKTSLDELPQFWNVLKGEMSLVGTRPPTPDEVDNYENWHRRRISIKPGITGLWQVSGRNQIQNFDEIVQLDLNYIDHWSIYFDIKILFMTVWVVFARRGSS